MSSPCSTCTVEGVDVLPMIAWMAAGCVFVVYVIGVYAFAGALRDEVLLREPDGTFARWAIGLWWPVFGLFRLVEFLAKSWRKKSWP